MSKIQSVAVFCGARYGNQTVYSDTTKQFITTLCRHHIEIIFGGANSGLMQVVANQVYKDQGTITGVHPKQIELIERAHPQLSKLISTETLSERKKHLIQLADAFLILPGGIGTLDELFEILTLNVLNIEAKPMVIVNTAGYYDHLLTFLKHSVDEGFTNKAVEQHLHSLTTTEELITQWRLA